MRILGLDVGEKRIGVARIDSDTRIAVPIGYILADGSEWQQIAKLSAIHNTMFFVLGLPRSNEGNETKQSQYVRNFAKTLAEKLPGIKIRFQDESLTSVVAEERLKSRGKPYEKGEIDAEAATIILEDFIENFEQPDPRPQETINLIEKEVEKMKLKTKKTKHKMKAITKWTTGIVILAIIAALATGGVFLIKEIRAKQRAEEYARQEAAMTAATFDFTIRPGETIYDIKKNLLAVNRNGEAEREDPLPNYTEAEIDAALKANYNYECLAGRPEGATLEGFLYPETHNFYGESTVEEIFDTFLKQMDKVILENNLAGRYNELGLTLFEGVTLASVVQKEASSPDQPTVAQVFLSRLDAGIPLGSDVTVSYALDTIDPDRITYSDNQAALKVDSCYNTRIYGGLPCGPISNPGLSALLAVAEPSDTSYLYFLTGDDGVMYYSSTEAEHNQKIIDHCQNLCNVSL